VFKLHDQREAWKRLADEIGADFVDISSIKMIGPIGLAIPMRVEHTYKDWTIILDTYAEHSTEGKSSIFTRMRAAYVSSTDFSFSIKRKTAFSRIAKAFGKKPIYTGDDAFDDVFVLKSNDEAAVKNLFSDCYLRELALDINIVNVRTRDCAGSQEYGHKENGKELYFSYSYPSANRAVTDINILKDLFKFFELLLDGLVKNNIALSKTNNAKS